MGRFRSFAASLLLVSAPAAAQMVAIRVEPPSCLHPEENAAVVATVVPDIPENVVRLYFHRRAHGDLYYVEMRREAPGRFWGVLPRPEEQNESVEIHVHVRSAQDQGVGSSPLLVLPVDGDCEVELTDEQEEVADELRVGETHISQRGRPVAWFLCDGIIERIDIDGEVRPDEFCGVPPGPNPLVDRGSTDIPAELPEPRGIVSPSQPSP